MQTGTDEFAAQLRPRSVVDQLDLAFRLYRRQFVTFIGIVAVLQVPLLIIRSVYSLVYVLPFNETLLAAVEREDPDAIADSGLWGPVLLGFVVVMALNALVDTLVTGALAYAVSRAYLGHPTDTLGAYDYLAHGPRLLSLLGAAVLVGLATGVVALGAGILSGLVPCLVCLALPLALATWLYLTLRLLALPQVVVLEDRGPLEAIGRTWRLIGGHLARALGLVVLVGLVTYIVPAGLDLLVQLGLASLPLPPAAAVFLQNAFTGLFQIAVLPVLLGTRTLFYYDLRIRKEGLDMRLHAERLMGGGQPA